MEWREDRGIMHLSRQWRMRGDNWAPAPACGYVEGDCETVEHPDGKHYCRKCKHIEAHP